MSQSVKYVGLDVHKDAIAAAVAEDGIPGFIQEGRAEDAMRPIRGVLAPYTAVLRDGTRRSIDAAELVPGDIVLLEAGKRVLADLRVIEARSLKAEEAILTGESVPMGKNINAVVENASLGDRSSLLFRGTLVAADTARGLVVATGTNTEIGHISGMLGNVGTLANPLVRQMDVFARWLTLFILLISTALLAFGIFVCHVPFDEMFMIVVGLAVAAIPEGLPAAFTMTLTVGVTAMGPQEVEIRQ